MLKKILVLLPLAGIAVASAQEPSDYPIHLTSYPSVRKELKLNAEVVGKIDKIKKESQAKFMAMIAPTAKNPNQIRDVDRATAMKERAKADRAVLALLSAEQKTRLMQIGFQYDGAFAFGKPFVVKALGITPDQRQKLDGVFGASIRKYQASVMPIAKPGSIVGRGDTNPKSTVKKLMEAKLVLMKAVNAGSLKVLTSAQRTKWAKMQGKPFDVLSLYAPVSGRTLAGHSKAVR